MENIKEIWKDIEGYENLYKISNLGRVKSLNYNRTGKEKILKSRKDVGGYFRIGLFKERKQKCYKVHRLVAQAFLDNPYNLPQVNHKDEDKTNNTIWINDDGSVDYNKSNLEWCDAKYNMNYGSRIERIVKSNSIPILQFSKEGKFIRKWNSAKKASIELGVHRGNIVSCLKGRYKSAYGYIWKYNR